MKTFYTGLTDMQKSVAHPTNFFKKYKLQEILKKEFFVPVEAWELGEPASVRANELGSVCYLIKKFVEAIKLVV